MTPSEFIKLALSFGAIGLVVAVAVSLVEFLRAEDDDDDEP